MSDPLARNRLDEEASPYLEQHAENPVNWQPWDEHALAAARERDRPIFLSIGYAACHWCHVMEEESFQDPEIAEILNEQFVPIKVDREERPDVDAVYMAVARLVTGGGGWPLSAFLTPDGDPFYVGTYFPPEPTRGQPGFAQLLEDIVSAWHDPDQRQDLENRAAQWADAVESDLESVPDQPGAVTADSLLEAATAAVDSADREFGGFGRGQKFPHPGRIDVLFRAAARDGPADVQAVALETLDAMADGGLYDHVGGGFHRYCTDREWVVPHFEKMLYDNAELPREYLTGYQVTDDERYARVARETFSFLDRELSHPEGGFYASLDARSPAPADWETDATHDVEGAFYVWTPASVREAVDDSLTADLLCDRFGIDEPGNFEGRTVLTRHASRQELADAYDLEVSGVERRLETGLNSLRSARSERPRPARDDKVIAGWNGLAIRALAEGALVLEDESYAERAGAALSFVRDQCWDDEAARLARRYKDGDASIDGYLEDYAFLAAGALSLYGVTGEVEHLAFATDLAERIVADFWDEDEGTLYLTPAEGERLIARPQELDDTGTPSSAGIAAATLHRLAQFVPDRDFDHVARGVLETHAETIDSAPLRHVSLVLGADEMETGLFEVTIAAENHLPAAWRRALARTYLPGRLLAPRPATDEDLSGWRDRLGLSDTPPVWDARAQRENEPTVYVCRRTCSPPLTDPADLAEWAEELSS